MPCGQPRRALQPTPPKTDSGPSQGSAKAELKYIGGKKVVGITNPTHWTSRSKRHCNVGRNTRERSPVLRQCSASNGAGHGPKESAQGSEYCIIEHTFLNLVHKAIPGFYRRYGSVKRNMVLAPALLPVMGPLSLFLSLSSLSLI